jgi:molybdopterin synthase catalytic subunit
MVTITSDPIDVAAVLERVRSPRAGAVVLFLGTAREFTGPRRTESLQYECYGEMAEKKLAELEAEAGRRWPLTGCALVHRVGRVPLGEVSVAVAVSSSHREEAFAAGKWLIDTLKQVVPIWKKENWADGTSDWVHPGVTDGPSKERLT